MSVNGYSVRGTARRDSQERARVAAAAAFTPQEHTGSDIQDTRCDGMGWGNAIQLQQELAYDEAIYV